MSYTIEWESKGFYRKFSGNVNGMEILHSNFELQIDPKFKDAKYIINDFTEITIHSIEIAHADSYAQTDDIISKSKGKLKIAIVVNNDSLIEIANYYRKMMKNQMFECEIFECIGDARNWTSND